MKILVVDVAAREGGALTVFNRYLRDFAKEKNNEYIVVGSIPKNDIAENIRYICLPWAGRNWLFRLWFDTFCAVRLAKKYKAEKIISLQNKAFYAPHISQTVLFQNVLLISDIRYSLIKEPKMWVYQHIIAGLTKNSLKYADKIIVQAPWVAKSLSDAWHIGYDRITVIEEKAAELFSGAVLVQEKKGLFYPAAFLSYKNHAMLFRCCAEIWKSGLPLRLILTGEYADLPADCRKIMKPYRAFITFAGKLSPEEMKEKYREYDLVFPSVLETVGLPLKEARTMGCKILAADLPYAHDSIGVYDKVSYFDPTDEDSLKMCLERWINENISD